MGSGSNSARPSFGLGLGLAIICLLTLTSPALGLTYTVGGAGGWTFNMGNWPNGLTFNSGDILAFNYASGVHNVVQVNKAGYNGCNTTRGSKVYNTGADNIRLSKGASFFICTFPGHCQAGMKIAVNAI